MKIRLWYNPKCSKSRRALELLSERGVDVEIVEYLETAPGVGALIRLIESSDSDPHEFVRRTDAAFNEAGLSLPDPATAENVAALLAENPAVLQRPIADTGGRCVIARPPERVLELL